MMKWTLTAAAVLLALPVWAQTPAPAAAPANHPAESDQARITKLQSQLDDFPGFSRYAKDNAKLAAPAPGQQRVVFYGDSITDMWGRMPDTGKFFPGKPYINRGISGQTTEQMLPRFPADVVALKPAAVLILAGTNDIAGNTGPETATMIEDDLAAMADIANAHGIKVILASILPAAAYPWKPGIQPAPEIKTINAWLQQLCTLHGYTYLDYYSAMVGPNGGMRPGISREGVHPNARGFAIMTPLAQQAINKTLAK